MKDYLNKIFIPLNQLSPIQFVCFFVFCIALLSLIVLIGFLIAHATNVRNYRKNLISGKNNVRIYSIHYNENKVIVFDKHDLKKRQVHDLAWLYNGVSQADQLRLKVWLTELKKEEHKVPHNLEIHVLIRELRQTVFSVLEVDSINYEKGIIHLESHLFPNINKIKKDKNTVIFIKSEDAMPAIVEAHNKTYVAVYNVRLFSTYEFDSNKAFRADHLIMTQIMNRLVKFASTSRYITLLKTNEICITDFSVQNTNGAIAIGHNFAKEVSRILFLNALQNQFSFKIGVVLDKTHTKSFQELSKTAKEMSIFAEDNDIQSPVILFDSSLNYRQLSQNTIVDNIRNVLEKDEIAYKYVPIIDGKNGGAISGYEVDIFPKRSLLSSFQEVQEYAYNNNLGDKLMHLILNKMHNVRINTANFSNSKSCKMFVDIQVPYAKIIQEIYNNPDDKHLLENIVLVFEDKDVISFSQEGNIVKVFDDLKESNISIALSLTQMSLDLSTEVTSKFDYFVLNENTFNDLLTSSKNQILFQDLMSKLISYHKDIIGINIASWQSLEYLIKQNITCYSTPLLGFAFDNLPTIDEKKYNKSLELFNSKINRSINQ